jgi:hypothetical protein
MERLRPLPSEQQIRYVILETATPQAKCKVALGRGPAPRRRHVGRVGAAYSTGFQHFFDWLL